MFQEGLKKNSFIVIGEGKKCFRRFVTHTFPNCLGKSFGTTNHYDVLN